MHNNAHFKTLEIKTDLFEESETRNSKWENSIYFDNEADAVDFLKKIKLLIKIEYPRAYAENWFK